MMATLDQVQQDLQSLMMLIGKPQKLSVSALEAAEMIGVSKSTIYKMMEDREITYSTVGGKKVIKVKELDEVLKWREVSAKRKK